jgi:hypothetical protein
MERKKEKRVVDCTVQVKEPLGVVSLAGKKKQNERKSLKIILEQRTLQKSQVAELFVNL